MVARKMGERFPSGKLRPERDVDVRPLACGMPHRMAVPEEHRHDPRAESAFGRLCLNGKITTELYYAGIAYRDIVMRYKAVISSPPSTPASMAGILIGPWGKSNAELDDNEVARRRDDYNFMYEALESGAGNRGARAVAHWVFDRTDSPIAHLVCGLNILHRHFELTRRAKS